MTDPGPPVDTATLLRGVRLVEDPQRARTLAERWPAPTEPRALSVSDLLAPRRAFWRRQRGPAPLAPERELKIVRGRAWHRRLGEAVAGEGALEVHLRRGGITARIDLLADVPVEIKTTSAVSAGDPPVDRPDQVEQLAAYCALAGRSAGRLVHLVVGPDGPPTVAAADLSFRDLAGIDAELRRREAALRAAIGEGRPERLGRCRWFGAACEYRSEGICDCRGDEADEPSTITDRLERSVPAPEVERRWRERLATVDAPTAAPLGRYRDLLYPRRTYFVRTHGGPPAGVPARHPSAPADAYERTMAALERGPVGSVHRLPTAAGAPDEEVLAWGSDPCLVRGSRVRTRLTPEEIVARFPQYILDLGFRCAGTGRREGTLVIGYELAAGDVPPVQVLRLELPDGVEPFARAWADGAARLEEAVRDAAPERLPACPGWMATDCPYRDACGCAGAPPRSQR